MHGRRAGMITSSNNLAMAPGPLVGKGSSSSIFFALIGHMLAFRASEVTYSGISHAAVLPDMSQQILPKEEIRRRGSLHLNIHS